jgi:DNA polymerase III, beta subunit
VYNNIKGGVLMNRIKELRKKEKITQQKLAELLDVSKRTIIAWEKEEREIKKEKAEQLAEYFNVAVGYILGYTDNPKYYNDEVIQIINGEKRSFSKQRDYDDDLNKFITFLRELQVVISDKQVINIFNLIVESDLFRVDDYVADFFNYEYLLLHDSEEFYNDLAKNGYSYTVDYIPNEDKED